MELFFGIWFIALSLFSFWLIYMLQKHYDDAFLSAGLGVIIMLSLIGGIKIINEYCYPSITPMDVYRGKTTLEITYKDSIAIDSVVVWKEEVK